MNTNPLSPKPNIERFLKTHQNESATIVFTDIVNWHAICLGLGGPNADAFTNRHRTVVRKVLKRFTTGEIVKELGDSFLIRFGLRSEAVQFALYLQARLRALPSERSFTTRDRVGIHSGEIQTPLVNGFPSPNKLKGLPISICNRVMKLAGPDQILMTSSVYEDVFHLLKGKTPAGLRKLSWKSHGFYLLKGESEVREIFEVGEADCASFQTPKGRIKSAHKSVPGGNLLAESLPDSSNTSDMLVESSVSANSLKRLTISNIPDKITNVGKAIAGIQFSIGAPTPDLDMRLASVIAKSSNQMLITNGSIFLMGSGTNRTMALYPAAGMSGKTTITVTVSATGIGSITTQFSVTVGDPSVGAPLVRDFNRDGFADLILENSEGRISFWSMNGWNRVAVGDFNPNNVGDLGWKVVGVGDFTNCGQSDLLFQHEDGTMAAWYMDGIQLIQANLLNPDNVGPGWRAAATGDVDNDGQLDIILQHSDGTIAVWLMDGINLKQPKLFDPNNPGDGWRIVAAGDLQKNDKVELIFQHTNGTLGVWCLNGLELKQVYKIPLPDGFDPGWRVKAIADLDKDGTLELVAQHTDGRLAAWVIDETIFKSAHMLNPDNPGPEWQLVGPK